ncbi:iron-containing alcohol dehydrogenase family protein [Kineosporia sp. A_224]|uniref:iron-containing alcohol dehydrogenase family protein n=1 Tax=Kineosporia sp. A_224 TaxID=1962180 RepID=UPI000B4B4E2C
MPLLARMVPSPVSVEIRRGAVAALGGLLADSRVSRLGRVAVAVGRGYGERIVPSIGPALEKADIYRVDDGSVDAALSLGDALRAGGYDALVGIGGGRTLDVGKYAAGMIGLPFVSVATTLTHDGLASPVASLEHNGRKHSYGVALPLAVVIDLDYVRQSPRSQLLGGIGDVVSNLNALADWRLAQDVHGEPVDGLAAAMAQTAGEAVLHHPGTTEDDDFLTSLAQGLVLSGLAMSVAGTSRPCSGSCHEICHAIDQDFPGRSTHGLQVAVGALFSSWLREDPMVGALDACLRRHGVPRLPADIGLTTEEFTRAVLDGPGTRPGRFTVLEHLDLGPDAARERVETFVALFGARA